MSMLWKMSHTYAICHIDLLSRKEMYRKGSLFNLKAKSKRTQEQQEDSDWGSLHTSNFILLATQKLWCSVHPNSHATPSELHSYWIVPVHTVLNPATDSVLLPPWGLNLFISAAHLEHSAHLSHFHLCSKFILMKSLAESRQSSPVSEIWALLVWPLIASGHGEPQ